VVTYSHTSIGPHGDAFVAGFTEEFYERFMRDWESRMNHYLVTGGSSEAGPMKKQRMEGVQSTG